MKTCVRCGESKDLGDFPKRAKSRDGRHPRCKACNSVYQAEYRERNREARAAYQAAYAANRPPRAEYSRAWFAQRPGYFKKYAVTRHGITVEQFERQVMAQRGKCAVCGSSPERLLIDHDHSHCGGEKGCPECIRGLLCNRCNSLESAADAAGWAAYLNRPRPFLLVDSP